MRINTHQPLHTSNQPQGISGNTYNQILDYYNDMITKYNQNPDETKNMNIPAVQDRLNQIMDSISYERDTGNITDDQYCKIIHLCDDMQSNLIDRNTFLNDANQMIDYIGTLVH